MVSRRNYFSIFLTILVIFFLFQGTLAVRERWNQYDYNSNVKYSQLRKYFRWSQDKSLTAPSSQGAAGFVVYFGKEGSDTHKVAKQWAKYNKYNIFTFENIEEFEVGQQIPDVLLIDGKHCGSEEDTALIESLIEKKHCDVIFMDLPEVEYLRQNLKLRELLGIDKIFNEEVEIEGVHFFDGFLLGGEKIYKANNKEEEKRQDLDLHIPWYVTLDGTKTYVVGMMKEDPQNKAQNEYLPAIIWRHGISDQKVFAVNGDYLKNVYSGMGILDSLMYEKSDCFLYPIINAQNLVVPAFPIAADENVAKVNEIYRRSQTQFEKDIMFPAIASLVTNTGFKMTSFFMPEYSYSDSIKAQNDVLEYYLKEYNEFDSEMGISMLHKDGSNDTVLNAIKEYFDKQGIEYFFNAAYGLSDADIEKGHALLENMHTIVRKNSGDEDIVDYISDNITLQTVTSFADKHTFMDDIKLMGIETALGYSTIEMNVLPALWPENEDDQWQKLSKDMMSNVTTYWNHYSYFDKTTISQSDLRMRSFLNLSYRCNYDGDTLKLNAETYNQDAYFILRTHDERVSYINNGEIKLLEKNVYLIKAFGKPVEIKLEKIEVKD